MIPSYILIGVSASIVVFTTYPELKVYFKNIFTAKDPSYQPLLQNTLSETTSDDNSSEHYEPVFEDIQNINDVYKSYGSTIVSEVRTDDEFVSPKFQSLSNYTFITVVRSKIERLQVAVEFLFTAIQAILYLLVLASPVLAQEWISVDGSYCTIAALTLFWLYLFALVTSRITLIRKSYYSRAGLWYHSTVLYALAWVFSLPAFRSALIHPYSHVSKLFHFIQFFNITVLVINNFSSKMGDNPVKLYKTNGIDPSAEPISSIFALTTFGWINPILVKGYRASLNIKDVWDLKRSDHASIIINRFRKSIDTHKSFTWKLIYFARHLLFTSAVWAILQSLVVFAPPFLMKKILEYVEDPSSIPQNVIWLYVFGMLAAGLAENITSSQGEFLCRRLTIYIRAVMVAEIYAKALRRKANTTVTKSLHDDKDEETEDEEKDKESEGQVSQGTIINLMAVDAVTIGEVFTSLYDTINALLTTSLCVVFLYSVIGWSAFVGTFSMALLMPINYKLSTIFSNYQSELMDTTDKRTTLLNEVLQNIRIVKFFAWEEKFTEKISILREKELRLLKSRAICWLGSVGIWFLSPVVITIVSFSTFIYIQGEHLTAPIAFTSLALFNTMKSTLDHLADTLNEILQSKVSINRVSEFLNENETSKYDQLKRDSVDLTAPDIGFKDASFSWESSSSTVSSTTDFKLLDLNVSFITGKLNIVIGPTGSGKTSLLLALLGEMELIKGKLYLPTAFSRKDSGIKIDQNGLADTVAYCAQQAWLLNDTVKNNILFGSEFNEERYNAVIHACALAKDIEIWEAGDATEIGEKGIVLSGGQKQRVSLARAIYSNSKHLLLDDCLSAVDSHTGIWIYKNCITGSLCVGRTIILVSHNVALTISQAFFVVALDNGRVAGQGTVSEVAAAGLLGSDELSSLSASQSEPATRSQSFEDLQDLNVTAPTVSSPNGETLSTSTVENAAEKAKSDGKLITEEKKEVGHVKLKVYLEYTHWLGNRWYWIFLTVILLGAQGFDMLQSIWIKVWTSDLDDGSITHDIGLTVWASAWSYSSASADIASPPNHSTIYYISIYALIGVTFTIFAMIRNITGYIGGLNASRHYFNAMLDSVLHSKIRFFDSTPIGRIMNRFSKDMGTLDGILGRMSVSVVQCALAAGSIVLLISTITPGFLLIGVFISIFYWFTSIYYLATSRELKRFNSISMSPLYQHFGETLSGIPTIRAYGLSEQFAADNLVKIDDSFRALYYLWTTSRWLSFRIDSASVLVSFTSACLIVLGAKRIDAGLAGVSLSYALTFSRNILWVVRIYSNLEMSMNAVERVQEYIENEPESDYIIPDSRPPINWPSRGEIEVNNLSLRYAPDLPRVIEDVTFKVDSFSKVGIVGRTGAGKSTIITSFFRFLEAETGTIKIDGVDISKIGLKDLRGNMAIIPQDPILFVGTIRSNLDPFDQYTDEEIYAALRRVNLIKADESIGDSESSSSDNTQENLNQFKNLNSNVTEGGGNLSQGQRQLICLARSILKSPKLLFLDEATASIDYESDALIQRTIRGEFLQATILTIAHRLRSIIDYDKILVLDAGHVAEFDSPYKLLLDKKSIFYSMCEDSGELDTLIELAKEAESA